MSSSYQHPDELFNELLTKQSRSTSRRNLTAIHAMCRQNFNSEAGMISVSTIGRLVEKAGIMKARTLYNAQSSDYKILINSWAEYYVVMHPEINRVSSDFDFLLRIEDPAIRSVVQTAIVERDKFRSELNILKGNINLIIDRRPNNVSSILRESCSQIDAEKVLPQFTPSELKALHLAVCPEQHKILGLIEGSHGEILNEYGRTLFEVGFARAIRKIIAI